jgi:4-hydroxy-3-polyprenylbenzoate decarboxylase
MYRTVREFAAALERGGELARVRAQVSPLLEIAAIADRESKSRVASDRGLPSEAARRTDPRFHDRGGRALLFENVEGSDVPVLINAFGSYRRMEMALGCDVGSWTNPRHWWGSAGFEAIAGRIGELVKPEPPKSLWEALRFLRRVAPLLRVPPIRLRGRGACQEVVLRGDAADIRRLPLIRCWPLDGDFEAVGYPAGINDGIPGVDRSPEFQQRYGGRYITLGGIHTIHARDADAAKPSSHNIGMYRVQALGPSTMAMHWHVHHDGAAHWRSWKEKGERMPVAIALGGESVLPYAATCPLPPGISELLMAGFLNKRGIEMCRGVTVPLWVPANAEIVIEGYVSAEAGPIGWDPRDPSAGQLGPGAVFEGPFGDHTGFYSMPDRYPILEVTAITHRKDPIYPTTIVGLPPQEDYYLGKATERIMLPLLKTILPDIEDYDLPMFGAFHNAAFIKINKHYPMHARRVMHGVWGAGQMSWTKTVVVVDEDVDVHDTHAVLRAVGERCVPGRDSESVRGPIDILDHATPFLGAGTKIGFDATRKWEGAEEHHCADKCGVEAINAVVGEQARESEARVRRIVGVLDARIPDELGGWWLLVRIEKNEPGKGAELIKTLGGLTEEMGLPRWTVVVGPDADLADIDGALFHWVANMSPERDRYDSKCGRRIAFDATPKMAGDERDQWPVRPWPPLITMSPEMIKRVDERWGEYGL